VTLGSVDAIPYQDPAIADRFPEVPRADFESAVRLIEADGAVYSGAQAVFLSLACNRKWAWLWWSYTHAPGFAALTESAYRVVAANRQRASLLTRLLWGTDPELPTYQTVRWLFFRGLGLIYLIAFLTAWWQVHGLIGSHGVLPAGEFMDSARAYFDQQHATFSRFTELPTWCWLSASEGFLDWLCGLGTVCSLLLVAGAAPAASGFLSWTLYLSLCVVHREFMSFQWDALLLETGMLAVFFAPLSCWPRRTMNAPVPKLFLWLLRWLLFRLLFESGCVKLLSGDPSWSHLTALEFHYETQPLPTSLGWLAHQFPAWFQKSCVLGMFVVELGLPFLVFGPRRLRFVAFLGFNVLQLWILLTGNYGFFNYLTMLLSVLLLDDLMVERVLRVKGPLACSASRPEAHPLEAHTAAGDGRPTARWPIWVALPMTVIIVSISIAQVAVMLHPSVAWLRVAGPVARWLAPFRSVNSYGLFAVMTTTRLEIQIEGSNDRQTWRPYVFKYKPGDLTRKPGLVAPYQPRLDWQMWFAALGTYRQNPWVINLCVRLLQGTPEVLHLLDGNPFPDRPPRYLRAVVYQYRFTTFAERRTIHDWWQREFRGEYLPVISLNDSGRTQTR
jgi:hypothetical protein